MLRANNYSITVNPDGPPVEVDSFTCGHCSKVTFVNARQRGEDVGGLCKVCMSLICPECVDLGKCDPFEEKLRRGEDHDRFLRQLDGEFK